MITPITPSPLGRIRRWIGSRSAAAALHRLDDHLLKDMGLTRSDINRAVITGRSRN
jgi:uncharacterized protein YjiS (DUF1127 family)